MWNLFSQFFYVAWSPVRYIIDPREWFKFPKRLVRISIPGLAALVTFVFLAVLTGTVVYIRLSRGDSAPGAIGEWVRWIPFILIGLNIAIPCVTYFAVKVWLQETGERFPDIEQAFKAGMEEMRRRGYDLQQLPLFLVLGSESDSREHNVMMSSRQEFQITRFPSGREPLHWYVSDDAIYIVLSGVGCTTYLAREAVKITMDLQVQASVAGPPKQGGVNMTYWPEDDDSMTSSAKKPQAAAAAPVPQYKPDLSRTIAPDDEDSIVSPRGLSASRVADSPKLKPLSPKRESLDLEERRLKFFCKLVAEARVPICPINGVVALLPLNMILADETAGHSLNSLRSDMSTLVEHLRMRFPVVPFVVGWEDDVGFQELTRRIGPEHSRDSRFGKGIGIWTPPTQYTLESIAEHACRGFETWIYKFFKQKDALEKTGNKLLYGLMCKVRRFLQPRLEIILKAFECDEEKRNIEEVPLISGVYFAAAGSKPDQQSFSSSVFARLNKELEGEVCWTPAALRAEAVYRTIAIVGFAIAAICAALIIFKIFLSANISNI